MMMVRAVDLAPTNPRLLKCLACLVFFWQLCPWRTYCTTFASFLLACQRKKMSRLEILNSGSLRLDGRLPLELRSLALHISPEAPLLGISTLPGTSIQGPDGSARVQQGLTSVYAAVYGPREALNRSNTQHDRAVVEVDVSLEPWSGKDRRKRAKGDRFV